MTLQKERLQRPVRCPDELWQLIEACWAQDPKDRPSFEDTLRTLQQQLQRQQREQGDGEAVQVEQQQAIDEGRKQPTFSRGTPGKQGATAVDAPYGGAAPQRSGEEARGQVGSQVPTLQQRQEEQPGPEEQDDVDAHVAVVC